MRQVLRSALLTLLFSVLALVPASAQSSANIRVFDENGQPIAVGDRTTLAIKVKCISGCSGGGGGGGTSEVDGSAFTAGASSYTPAGGLYKDAATALADGVAAAFKMTAYRGQHVNLRNNSGAEIGISGVPLFVTGAGGTFPVTGTFWQATQPVSGTFWQATQPVSGPLTDTQLRATAVPVSGTVTTGNLTDTQLRATAVPVSGTVTANLGTIAGVATAVKQPALGVAGTAATDVITVQGIAGGTALPVSISNGSTTDTDDGTVAGGQSSVALTLSLGQLWDGSNWKRMLGGAVRPGASDVGVTVRPLMGTNGTQDMPTMDAAARPGYVRQTDGTLTAVMDPCAANAKVYLPISQATGTQLITGTASKKIYICSIFFNAADAENVSVVAGTGTVCATSTVAVIGATTAAAGNNLVAGSGYSLGNGASSIAATTVNADNLCLLQSGSGRVAGVMSYVVQ